MPPVTDSDGRFRAARRRPVAASAALIAVAVLTAGCSSQSDAPGDAGSDRDPAPPTVTVPPARTTPFCRAMIDLGTRLAEDPPEDVTKLIVDTYQSIADDVPAEIAEEFAFVLATLRAGASPTTSSGPSAAPDADDGPPAAEPDGDESVEGYTPSEDPAARLNEYVEFTCRDSGNNPGPAATPPLDGVPLRTDPAATATGG